MTSLDSRVARRSPALDRPRQRRLGDALRAHRRLRIGIVQVLYVVGGVALGVIVPRLSVGATVSSSKTTEMLVAVGAGFVPFIGIVYSLLFLVVQFGSTTFTPRLSLFRDAPIVWHAFSFFTSVIVFAFTAAFEVGAGADTTALVPVVLSIAVLTAIGLLRALQTAAFRSIQLSSTLVQVGELGREVIDGVYPHSLHAAANDLPGDVQHVPPSTKITSGSQDVFWPGRMSTLQAVNVPRLLRVAEREDALIELCVGPGETLQTNARIAIARPGRGALDSEVIKTLRVGSERTFEQDPALALRVLADIALRALSPAVNDPTTAAQTLDTLDGLLRTLATRDLDVQAVDGSDGTPRVVLKLPGWEDYLSVALDEIMSTGMGSIQVQGRVRHLLEDLLELVPPRRRGPIQARLDVVPTRDSPITIQPDDRRPGRDQPPGP